MKKPTLFGKPLGSKPEADEGAKWTPPSQQAGGVGAAPKPSQDAEPTGGPAAGPRGTQQGAPMADAKTPTPNFPYRGIGPGEGAARPGFPPGAPTPGVTEEEGAKLIVGKNIRLKGEIADCDTLVVEGHVEASMRSRIIEIAEGGVFVGKVEIDSAHVRGTFEGDLTARERLTIHATGKVSGHIRYGQVAIEAGGEIAGETEVLGKEAAKKPASPSSSEMPSPAPRPVEPAAMKS